MDNTVASVPPEYLLSPDDPPLPPRLYTQTITAEQYTQQAKEYTAAKVKELLHSPEFVLFRSRYERWNDFVWLLIFIVSFIPFVEQLRVLEHRLPISTLALFSSLSNYVDRITFENIGHFSGVLILAYTFGLAVVYFLAKASRLILWTIVLGSAAFWTIVFKASHWGWISGFGFILYMIMQYRQLNCTARVFSDACKAILCNPLLLLLPVLFQVLFHIYMVYSIRIQLAMYIRALDPVGTATRGRALLVGLYYTLHFYWVHRVLSISLNIIASGVVAQTFCDTKHTTTAWQRLRRSLARALTTSAGTIALGGLVMTLVSITKATLARFQRFAPRALQLCLWPVTSAIEGAIDFVTHYTFVIVAIHGVPFCTAARRSCGLLRHHGVDAVVASNFTLVVTVIAQLGCHEVFWTAWRANGGMVGLPPDEYQLLLGVLVAGVYYQLFALVRLSAETVFVCSLLDNTANSGVTREVIVQGLKQREGTPIWWNAYLVGVAGYGVYTLAKYFALVQ